METSLIKVYLRPAGANIRISELWKHKLLGVVFDHAHLRSASFKVLRVDVVQFLHGLDTLNLAKLNRLVSLFAVGRKTFFCFLDNWMFGHSLKSKCSHTHIRIGFIHCGLGNKVPRKSFLKFPQAHLFSLLNPKVVVIQPIS